MRIPSSDVIIIPFAQFSKFGMYIVSAFVLYASYVNNGAMYSSNPPAFHTLIILYGMFELIVGFIALVGKKESWWLALIACFLPFMGYLIAQLAAYANWTSGYALQWLMLIVSLLFSIPVLAWWYSSLIIIIASVTLVEILVLLTEPIKERYRKSVITRESFQRLINWSLGN